MALRLLSAALVVGTISALALAPAGAGSGGGASTREDCSTRSIGQFPKPFANANNLTVGPLAIVGAGGVADYVEEVGGNKFPVLVKRGHRVRVSIQGPRGAGLVYGRGAGMEGHRAVTFTGCPVGEDPIPDDLPPPNPGGAKLHEFWSGFIVADSPRCVPLLVRVDGRRQSREVTLRFGVEACG